MIDTVKKNKGRNVIGQDSSVLAEARAAWESLHQFRVDAARNVRFVYGDQWLDRINVNGKVMTERKYIESKGKRPQQFNRIASFVNAIIGQYVQSPTEPVCSARTRETQSVSDDLTTIVQYAYQRNRLNEIDKNSLREFVITGIVCHRTTFGWDDTDDISDVNVVSVNHNRLFFDRFGEDCRHRDISLIGEIHDMSINDALSIFGGTAERINKIRDIYGRAEASTPQTRLDNLNGDRLKYMDFLTPDEPDRVRVIEVWKREAKTRYRCHDRLKGEEFRVEESDIDAVMAVNDQRIKEGREHGMSDEDIKLIDYVLFTDRYWYYRFLSPTGHILAEGETPYEHKLHPYSLKVYPMINGEIHSSVSLVIEPQKYLNRLMTMQDFVQDSSAKGALLFPDDAISPMMDINEARKQWSDPNGVVIYNYKVGGGKPEQVVTHGTSTGSLEMFNVTNKLFDDIGGVSSALQGQSARANTPASLYIQQAQNSAILLTDILTSFQSFREDRDRKMLRLQMQFYDEPRYLNIVGDSSTSTFLFDPDNYEGVKFDLQISSSSSTPIARAMSNELLMKLLEVGQIDGKMLLEVGAFPFGDKLLQLIQQREEEMKQQQAQAQEQQQEQQQINP